MLNCPTGVASISSGTPTSGSTKPGSHFKMAPKPPMGKRLISQTKSQIEDRLVAEYGDAILAAPPRHGFGLLAWWLPIAGIVVAAVVVGAGAWRWSRAREPAPRSVQLDPALERRLDDELRRFEG